MVYTPGIIAQKLRTSDQWLQRGLLALYGLQDPGEQATQTTCFLNGRGFNRVDARILSGFAQQIQATHSPLSDRQLDVARVLMPKYARQLSRIANA